MFELLALTDDLPERLLVAGETLINEGDTTGNLYVLVEGRLMVRRGGEDFIAIDTPGACVGEMAVLLEGPHTANVVVVEASRVRVIENASVALDDDPLVLHAVATLLARRLNLLSHYLVDLQQQYRDVDGGLGMIGDILRDLASHHGDHVEAGSDREPNPLY